MPDLASLPAATPLTTLSEDETLFRDNVRQFAEEKVRPLAREMDEKSVFDQGLLEQFFQLGLMGIEVPEELGGAGGKFFDAILAVEELSRAPARERARGSSRRHGARAHGVTRGVTSDGTATARATASRRSAASRRRTR